MSEHAKGKWRRHNELSLRIEDSEGRIVAEVWDFRFRRDEVEAHLRLLMKAPELLEVVKQYRACSEHCESPGFDFDLRAGALIDSIEQEPEEGTDA